MTATMHAVHDYRQAVAGSSSVRHILAVALVLATAAVCLFCFMNMSDDSDAATSGTTGDCTWSLDDSGNLTISGNGAMGDYYYGQEPWGTDIKTATIGEGVTNVSKMAFSACASLTSVTMPTTVTSIGMSTFDRCSALTTVNIPSGVTSIGKDAFMDCSSLTDVRFASGSKLETIDAQAFYGCKLATINQFPSTLTSVDYSAFYGLTFKDLNDQSLTVNADSLKGKSFMGSGDGILYQAESGITGDCTWYLCKGALTITGNGAMGDYTSGSPAPWGTSIASLTINDGVKSVGSYAFAECNQLESVSVPGSVTSIGSSAFYKATSISTVDLRDNLTTVGDHAFSYCSAITAVALPDSVTTIGKEVFAGCTSLVSVDLGNVRDIPNAAFMGCTALTGLSVLDDMTSIGEMAFYGCSSITQVTISEKVTNIGNKAFLGCTSLSQIDYCAADCADLLPAGDSFADLSANGVKVIFHDTVNSIPANLFANTSQATAAKLVSVDIASSVTVVGDDAFGSYVFKDGNTDLPADATDLAGHVFTGDGDGVLKTASSSSSLDTTLIALLIVAFVLVGVIAGVIALVLRGN